MSAIVSFVSHNADSVAITAVLITAVLLAWIAYLHNQLTQLKRRSRVFFEGKSAKDLEDLIYSQVEKINSVSENINKINSKEESAEKKLEKCIQKVSVVRFNPFGEVGGNQSFAIALLDKHLSGVMILSLYSREGVRVYSKAIKEGKSEYKLSKEEEEAIKLADKS